MTNFPILFGLSSKNKIKQWSANSDLLLTDKGIEIIVTWGYYGDNFKKQTKSIFVTSGKNLNKANATTIVEQTHVKLQQLYVEQKDSGYVLDINLLQSNSASSVLIKKPQLATKFKDRKKFIKVDEHNNLIELYYGQPKLNGSRMFVTKISDTELVFSSRSGKLFKNFTHFTKELLPVLNVGDIVDGEIFSYDIPFENIQSLVNSDSLDYVIKDADDTVLLYKVEDLEYHVYDFISSDTNLPFKSRSEDVKLFESKLIDSKYIKIVETVLFTNFNDFKIKFNEYISKGYEGLMLRNENGLYKFGYRTPDLIKYKEMLQDEFEILDVYLAENDPTKVQILCKNRFSDVPEYSTFDIGSLLGNKEENVKIYFDKKSEVIGKYLTVDYQALSKYNVPLFPVGIVLRAGSLVNNEFIPES